jgi:hypothetical protein
MKRIRRTKAQIQADRLNQWLKNKMNGYAGFYGCSKCKEVVYCTGRTRENVKCRSCFGLEE